MSKIVQQDSWEAELERREQEEARRVALAYAESVRAAYASPDAPPLAPDSVIRMTGSTREEAPGAVGQLISAQLHGSLDYVRLIPMLNVPLDAIVTGIASTDGTDNYQASYTDEAGRLVTIDLGPDRVLAEWAEAILAERRWRASPSAKRWQHPRPSDLV